MCLARKSGYSSLYTISHAAIDVGLGICKTSKSFTIALYQCIRKVWLNPFHNWRTSTLQHFAIGFFWLRTSFCIRCRRFMVALSLLRIVECTVLRRGQMRSKFLQRKARTNVRMFYNFLCTRKSDARFFKIVR